MTDPFDRFLAEALAPPARLPDRGFASQVQARIALDERLRAREREVLRRLPRDLVAVAATGAALALLARAPTWADLGTRSPGLLLGGIVAAFAFLLLALCWTPSRQGPASRHGRR